MSPHTSANVVPASRAVTAGRIMSFRFVRICEDCAASDKSRQVGCRCVMDWGGGAGIRESGSVDR